MPSNYQYWYIMHACLRVNTVFPYSTTNILIIGTNTFYFATAAMAKVRPLCWFARMKIRDLRRCFLAFEFETISINTDCKPRRFNRSPNTSSSLCISIYRPNTRLSLETRDHQEKRYPNVTWHISYLFTYLPLNLEWHARIRNILLSNA